MSNYSLITAFLSSSELNRCRKNNLDLHTARATWHEILKYPWLTRKLRRKIGHMIQLNILPVIYKPLIGLWERPEAHKYNLPGLYEELSKAFLAAEDKEILRGSGL